MIFIVLNYFHYIGEKGVLQGNARGCQMFSKKNKKMVVNLHKNEQRKTLNMAKTISKLANSLTKNVFSNKIISDTKTHEKR